MKKFLTTITIFTCIINAFGQDLIVTKSKDSIACRITKIKKENIYFVFKNETEFKSTLIPVSKVISYKYDFYKENHIPKKELPGRLNREERLQSINYKRFRFAISGGLSYDPSRLSDNFPSGFEDYYQDLQSGYHVEGSSVYYFAKNLGIGFKYSLFKSSNSLNNVTFTDEFGNESIGVLSDDISVSYFGVVSSLRFPSKNKKNAFLLNSALGYLRYKNQQRLDIPLEVTANSFGAALEIGYDFEVSEDFSLGVQIGSTAGIPKKIQIDNGSNTVEVDVLDGERPQGSARLDFSLGLRYNLQ